MQAIANLVLADDFVEALVSVLPGWGFTVASTANTISRTLASVRECRPDICLLDRYFADGDGIEVIGEVRRASEGTKVVVLTADRDVRGMRQSMGAGASGYVNKTRGLGVLVEVLRGVAAGKVVVELASGGPRVAGMSEARRLAAYLTARERECLEPLVEGLSGHL